MPRTFRPSEPPASDETLLKLPTDQPIACYYRQSTLAQVGNISTTIQIDLVEDMKKRGWHEDLIYPINADEGVSGTTAQSVQFLQPTP